MKKRLRFFRPWYLMLGLLALPDMPSALAQDPNSIVTIRATDAQAAEAWMDTGTFTVSRTGATNFPLLVFYQLSGTASNGVDYEQLGGSVQIPAGALAASFIVKPIDDSLVEGTETVIAQIAGSPLACVTCGYSIGTPNIAEIFISDNDTAGTNHPPFVHLNVPQDGAVFTAPATIALHAYARDVEDRYFVKVEFLEGTNSLGLGAFAATTCPDPYCPYYALIWSNVPAGQYILTARATDSAGASSISDRAQITVLQSNVVQQPVVNIFATDDTGSEIPVVPPWLGMVQRGDGAVFTVTRDGATNAPLTIFYSIGGTASNGVDYVSARATTGDQRLSGRVVIPAGASSADIEIAVIDDLLVEGTETVEVTIQPPICIAIFPPPPDCYRVGPTNHALAFILDNDLTPAPVVTIVAADPDASESGSDTATFTISRTGETNNPLLVFYTIGGTAQLGIDYRTFSNFAMYPSLDPLPDVLIPAGARAVDITVTPIDDNLAEGSETVRLQLEQPDWARYLVGAPGNALATIADNDVLGTNHPPFVRLITPHDGEAFVAPADIALVAFTQDVVDRYKVEFFEGTRSLGFGSFFPGRCAVCPNYGLTWSNVPPGQYTLTAKATDNTGASSVSDPVHITVSESNRPPLVNIVARDPFASEGANFWRNYPQANMWTSNIWQTWGVNLGGTNTATFVVSRQGSTNAGLTVNYEIAGTASNGVDYTALLGSVAIPAGKRSGHIVVVPIDDSLVEGIETILLKLKPSTDYTIGFPSHASAIIIDNDRPSPPCVMLRDHQFHLWQPATNGFCFRIEASTDLGHWTALCTNVVTDEALHFIDSDATSSEVRFYRVASEPPLPPDN